jgi:hypothetical protein
VFFAKGWPGNTTQPVAQEIDGNGNPRLGPCRDPGYLQRR